MIWVTGCSGMLGAEICRGLLRGKKDFIGTGSELDISDFEKAESFSYDKNISAIINCAAYTSVDKAESEPRAAEKANVAGPENLSRIAEKKGAAIIHFSSDYVFDGTSTAPYKEDDPVSPLGIYGATKAEGDDRIRRSQSLHYIIRTSWLYGDGENNFPAKIIRLLNSRDEIKVVDDQKGSPTFCRTVSDAVIKIIGRLGTDMQIPGGTYNLTDSGEATWFDFAREIRRLGIECGAVKNTECRITACTSEEFNSIAKRPHYSVLDKTKIRQTLKIMPPDWKDSLADFFSLMQPNQQNGFSARCRDIYQDCRQDPV